MLFGRYGVHTNGTVCVLCTLYDLFKLVETRADLTDFLRRRIVAADVDENPFLQE